MITDPAERAAAQLAVQLSADIELQLTHVAGGAPVLALLGKARQLATNAIVALAEVDPDNAKAIRDLQNEIVIFKLIVAWLKEIVAAGFDAGDALDEDERDDLAEAIGLSPDDADEARRAGLPPADLTEG